MPPNVPKLIHGAKNRKREFVCDCQKQEQPPLGQLLAFAHRTVQVKFDHFKPRYSSRKAIPTVVKTLGDHILLKRIKANLSQPELALKSLVSVRKVKAWEYDQIAPNEAEWRVLSAILKLEPQIWTPPT